MFPRACAKQENIQWKAYIYFCNHRSPRAAGDYSLLSLTWYSRDEGNAALQQKSSRRHIIASHLCYFATDDVFAEHLVTRTTFAGRKVAKYSPGSLRYVLVHDHTSSQLYHAAVWLSPGPPRRRYCCVRVGSHRHNPE